MNPDYNKIFIQSSCLTNSEMIEYLSGKLSEKDKRRIEIHIADCEMCNDELEGLSNMKNINDLPLIISSINNEIDLKIQEIFFNAATVSSKKFNLKRILSVAASVALLITIGFVINNLANETSDNLAQSEISINETFEKEAEIIFEEEKTVDEVIVAEDKKADPKVFKEEAEIMFEEEKTDDEIIVAEEKKTDQKVLNEKVNENRNVSDFESEPIISTGSVENKVVDNDNVLINFETTLNDDESVDKVTEINMVDVSETVSKERNKKESKNLKDKLASVSDETEEDLNKTFFGLTRRNVPMARSENSPSESHNYTSIRNSGLLSYNIKSYKEATADFDNYLNYKPEDYEIVYKSGMSYYYQKKYTSSINRFNKIITGDINKYVEDAKWYKSIALINQGKEKEALKLLNQIVISNGKYQKRALDAINQLENK